LRIEDLRYSFVPMSTRTLPQVVADACCDTELPAMMPPEEAERATADLEILAHPIRMQLLDMLVRREGGEVCVCDLEGGVAVKQPTVSHHLKLLREAGLVSSERRGLYAYYQVNRDALDALRGRISERLAALG
jgi:ArsR family transcriptional regulator, arsenate/arsenite/antimonite-responsive transcriptional repressor